MPYPARAKRRGNVRREEAIRRESSAPDLKKLLASAPLYGIEIERPRGPGREIDCDEDEGRFNETLKRIVPKQEEGKGEN